MERSERSPVTPAADGVTVSVKVTPRASRARIIGVGHWADGSPYLAIAVTAAPEDGKANAAVIKLLAKEWHVAKGAISVATGAASRRKSLHVAGDPNGLHLDLTAWIADIR